MFSVKYTTKAEEKLFEIYSFIAKDNPFIAAKVIMKIKSSVDILKFFPLSGKILDKNYRYIVEPKHNYKIVYEFFNGIIYILSVFKYQNNWE